MKMFVYMLLAADYIHLLTRAIQDDNLSNKILEQIVGLTDAVSTYFVSIIWC